jgi:MFS family permease
VLGSSIGFIDGGVVNVALPTLQREMAAGLAAMQWVVNAYLLMPGALVLVGRRTRRPSRPAHGIHVGPRRVHAGLGGLRSGIPLAIVAAARSPAHARG